MKLSADDRIIEIVRLLMDSSGYLNADGLATQLKISKRNVYYALEDINTILAKRKEQPLLAEYGKA